jgi:hypothetical protein
MIEFIFTLDYEIYGNGQGSLRKLVLDPTQRLAEVFEEFDAPFVVFAEAVEFAKIEEAQSDPDITAVRAQLRELRTGGHEIGLHLHPWWAGAQYEKNRWHMDWSERNVCALKEERIDAIVSDAICYLRDILNDSDFVPLSFRSGLWVMQPTGVIAKVLARHGIEVDSSLFKGGRVRGLGLDYRPAKNNGSSWRFTNDVNRPEPGGFLLEVPIYTQMVPFWAMLGSKRLKLQSNTRKASQGSPLPRDWRDFVRLHYPRKLDFCRMTFAEMREVIKRVLEEEHESEGPTPIVAIGHSKDFVDAGAVRNFLTSLRERDVAVTTFSRMLCREPQLSA